MKNVVLGLIFVAVTFSACGGAGAPKNFSGAFELQTGYTVTVGQSFQVGACFLESGTCNRGNANNKVVTINAKVGDTKVPFSILDLKTGDYQIILADSADTLIGGLIDASENFVTVAPPKSDLKITIKPSLLPKFMPPQIMVVKP
jgi:hypothetical protein